MLLVHFKCRIKQRNGGETENKGVATRLGRLYVTVKGDSGHRQKMGTDLAVMITMIIIEG
jgi:hypothetical protein